MLTFQTKWYLIKTEKHKYSNEGNNWYVNILYSVSTLYQNIDRHLTKTKTKGKHLGRPKLNLQTLSKQDRQTLESHYQDWKDKKITGVQFADMLQLKKNSFYKIIKEYEETLTLQHWRWRVFYLNISYPAYLQQEMDVFIFNKLICL